MEKQKKENCPLCPNHCSLDSPQCGKGHAYARNGDGAEKEHHSYRENFRAFRGEKRGHTKADPSKASLPYLLMYSSRYLHKMFHERNIQDEEKLFVCLDETEQKQLKLLLQKLLTHWGQQERKTE